MIFNVVINRDNNRFWKIFKSGNEFKVRTQIFVIVSYLENLVLLAKAFQFIRNPNFSKLFEVKVENQSVWKHRTI